MKEIKSKSELSEILNGDKPVMLDFYAEWCGPCQSLLPIVESLAVKHKDDFVIAKIDVDKNRDIAQEYGVRSIPTLKIIKDQVIQETIVGLKSKEMLDSKIHEYTTSVV